MDNSLLEVLEERIETLIRELEALRARARAQAIRIEEQTGELQTGRQLISRLELESGQYREQLRQLEAQLAAAPDPNLLSALRGRVVSLIERVETLDSEADDSTS